MGSARARIHLRQISVSNRCTVDWNRMRGDDATRFCGACKQHVHNLSAMIEQQVEALLARGEEACVRYAYRPDGTIVTSASGCATTGRRASPALAAGVAGALATTAAFSGITAVVDEPSTSTAATAEEPVQIAMGGLRLMPIKPRVKRDRPVSDVQIDLSASEPEPTFMPPMPAPPPAPAQTAWWAALVALIALIATLGLARRTPVGDRNDLP